MEASCQLSVVSCQLSVAKNLTITVSQDLYDALHRVAGGRRISGFNRNFGHAQFAGCQKAGAAGDHDPVGAGKNRVRPAKLGDRRRDLGDLFVTMRARRAYGISFPTGHVTSCGFVNALLG